MKQFLFNALFTIDSQWAQWQANRHSQKPILLIITIHSLFNSRRECEEGNCFPHEGMLVSQFKALIEACLERGFIFISPDELRELRSDNAYVMLTFDDGYYNNQRALKILREFEVPATFAIASNYVVEPRAFWWDIHFRNAKAKGKSLHKLLQEQQALKQISYQQVESLVRKDAFQKDVNVQGDIDRPFNDTELRDFANEKWVHIANHTRHHTILPYYTDPIITSEIVGASEDLRKITGKQPSLLVYPNGEANAHIAEIAQRLGIQTACILNRKCEQLPLREQAYMQLSRVQFSGFRNIRRQLALTAAPHSITRWMRAKWQ